jgi:hypothetical protein
METVGEKTLNVVMAFIAMRLEFHWQRFSVDKFPKGKLVSKNKVNQIEFAIDELVH